MGEVNEETARKNLEVSAKPEAYMVHKTADGYFLSLKYVRELQ